MNSVDTIKIIASVIGVVISLPLAIALIRAGMVFGTMQQTIIQVQQSFDKHVGLIEAYMERTEQRFEDNEAVITEQGGKIAVLWDGHERRKMSR